MLVITREDIADNAPGTYKEICGVQLRSANIVC
jgi:hypothetical protein